MNLPIDARQAALLAAASGSLPDLVSRGLAESHFLTMPLMK